MEPVSCFSTGCPEYPKRYPKRKLMEAS
jgi:hypothetical protein